MQRNKLISIICSCLILCCGIARAQKDVVHISFPAESRTVGEAIRLIEHQSGYSFFYQTNTIDLSRKTTVGADKETVEQVLSKLFDGSSEEWSISGKQIYLKHKGQSQGSSAPDKKSPQKRTITGTVVDATDGLPIIGAGVQLKSSRAGTVTDPDGRFSIDITGESAEIIISSLGYKDLAVFITDQGVIDAKLEPDNEVLSEVVVVGAGTQRRVSVTGAIAAIEGNTLTAPTSSLTNTLAGKLAGVISVTTSGQPGSTSDFYIRGISTFGGRTAPLILLDGVEITASDLNNIPAESIESFSILKDASATAIYGARGANGVMIVTTKTGSENTKARINVTVETSVLQPVNIVEYADGATFMEAYNNAQLARNPNVEVRYSETDIANTRNRVNPSIWPDVDWYDLMFRDYSMSQRANVNVSGGGSHVTYYMSLQMNHDGGILDVPQNYSFDNNYNRWLYTFQNNIGYQITPSTKMALKMNAQIISQTSPSTSANSIFQAIYNNTPVSFPAIFPEQEGYNHLLFGSQIMSAGRFYTNPYANMLNTFQETNTNKLNISVTLNQKLDFITEGLSVNALVNFNNYASTWYTRSLSPYLYNVLPGSYDIEHPVEFRLNELQVGTEYVSQSGISTSTNNTFYLDGRINYDRSFGHHNVTAMLMYMMRQYRSGVLPNRNQGFSGRFTYDWYNRYLVELNFGYNGTERLAEGERFELFPAISIGWVPSSEPFWKSLRPVIDYLKFRGSYGLVGSDETGTSAGAAHFLYENSVSMSGGMTYRTGYTGNTARTGPSVTAYAVEGAHWERAKELDLGVDMELFEQLNITFDWYYNQRERILMKRASFPKSLGYASSVPWSNIGKVDNTGLELSVKWKKQLTRDFLIDLRSNFTYAKNKYVYVDEPDYPYVWQTETGKPLSRMTGYIAEGLFQSDEEIATSADQSSFGSSVMVGDIRYRDVNGDGKITTADQVMLSPYGSMPRIQYGFGCSLNWRKLDFSVYFNGSALRNIMLSGFEPFIADDSNDHNLMKWIADGYWREGEDNTNATYPRLGLLKSNIYNNRQPSSFWMRRADFLRFKTIELGWSFPFGRVYINGDNIAVWSPFEYWDPELSYYSYPLSRTFNLGVQFKF
ncbi:MAG: TonB-dependent receptor [Bacteroidales bacterium]|nr:TonB-dependent receptor [Bacteroidales bacterium]